MPPRRAEASPPAHSAPEGEAWVHPGTVSLPSVGEAQLPVSEALSQELREVVPRAQGARPAWLGLSWVSGSPTVKGPKRVQSYIPSRAAILAVPTLCALCERGVTWKMEDKTETQFLACQDPILN